MHQSISTKRQIKNGFSLLEMAVSLIILGLFVAPLLILYNNYTKTQETENTYKNIQVAVDALQNFRRMNGHYPYPAPMTLPRSDPAHGHPHPGVAGGFAPPTGECDEGICIEESLRDPATAPPGFDNRVVVAALPFRALQMEERGTVDSYGAKLFYAVTESMTDASTFNDNAGAISIMNPANQSMVQPEGSAGFVVFSTGITKTGAYNIEGRLISPCNGAAMDVENCHPGFETGTNPDKFARYIASYKNDAEGSDFYDDQIMYYSQISDPYWKRTDSDEEAIEDLSPNNVGVGTATPTQALDISSINMNPPTDSLRIYGDGGAGGDLYVDLLCDELGANCFDVTAIAGDHAAGTGGMRCDVGEYMIGIRLGEEVCATEIDVGCPPPGGNPLATILIGADASGQAICAVPPQDPCPATTVTLCDPNDVSLPLSPDTFITGSFFRGACRQSKYKCVNGNWQNAPPNTGVCTIGGPVETCGIPCGTGWSGAYCQTVTPLCPTGSTSSNTFATDCTCIGGTFNEEIACSILLGPGWTGMAYREVTYTPPTCTPNDPPWDTAACLCTIPDPAVRVIDDPSRTCDPGWVENPPFQIQQTFNPGTCTWGSDVPLGDCECDVGITLEDRDHNCNLPGGDPLQGYNPIECFEPDPSDPDQFEIEVISAGCVEVETQTYVGSCKPKNYTWSSPQSTGVQAAGWPPGANFIGDSCSCADHQATVGPSTESCFYQSDPTFTIYRCDCL